MELYTLGVQIACMVTALIICFALIAKFFDSIS